MKQPEYILKYIKEHFSDTKNKDIAEYLNISISTVIRAAKQLNLKKSEHFLTQLKVELIQSKKDSCNRDMKKYHPTKIQENIIVGSLLGDGSLARSYWGVVDKIRRLRKMAKFKEKEQLWLSLKLKSVALIFYYWSNCRTP